MKPFKIRCSSIGHIMAKPKSGASLSVGAMTYCDNWIKTRLFNDRTIMINSPCIAKGNIMEDNSIDFIAQQLGYGFLIKNDEEFEDEYKTGTPDILPRGERIVIDVKNSWDWKTFPLLEDELPNELYRWQVMGYMSLTGCTSAKVIYTLMDTPQYLIEKAARSYCFNQGYDELDPDVYAEFERNMTYPDVPDRYKIKQFVVERNEEDIERIDHVVNDCRKYIDEKIKDYK